MSVYQLSLCSGANAGSSATNYQPIPAFSFIEKCRLSSLRYRGSGRLELWNTCLHHDVEQKQACTLIAQFLLKVVPFLRLAIIMVSRERAVTVSLQHGCFIVNGTYLYSDVYSDPYVEDREDNEDKKDPHVIAQDIRDKIASVTIQIYSPQETPRYIGRGEGGKEGGREGGGREGGKEGGKEGGREGGRESYDGSRFTMHLWCRNDAGNRLPCTHLWCRNDARLQTNCKAAL